MPVVPLLRRSPGPMMMQETLELEIAISDYTGNPNDVRVKFARALAGGGYETTLTELDKVGTPFLTMDNVLCFRGTKVQLAGISLLGTTGYVQVFNGTTMIIPEAGKPFDDAQIGYAHDVLTTPTPTLPTPP